MCSRIIQGMLTRTLGKILERHWRKHKILIRSPMIRLENLKRKQRRIYMGMINMEMTKS